MSDCIFIPPIIQAGCPSEILLLDAACSSPKSVKAPFVSSYQGRRGFAGCDGAIGINGINGAPGVGIPGAPGTPGAPGKPGRKGKSGCSAGNGICSQAIFR